MKRIIRALGVLGGLWLWTTGANLYAYNNQWSDNEDYVVVDLPNGDNEQSGEGVDNKEVKGASVVTKKGVPVCPSRRGSPVYLKSGHFVWDETDIVLPGKPGIVFSRTYTSYNPINGLFGNGWISNFESGFVETIRYLKKAGKTQTEYIFRTEDGIRYRFIEQNGKITKPVGMYQEIEHLDEERYKVNYPDKSTEIYKNDRKLAQLDANGNRLDFIYDSDGLLIQVKDGHGNVLNLTYGGNGYVTAITDQTGRAWSYSYDSDGNLVTVINPDGSQRNYEYEQYVPLNDRQIYFNLTKVTDETGREVISVTYNSGFSGSDSYKNGRVNFYTEGENRLSYYWGYLDGYNEGDKTDSLDHKTEMYMDDSGHIVKYKNPRGYYFVYNIDENMTIKGVTDWMGNFWPQSVDELGRVLSKGTPMDHNTTYRYDGDRRVPSVITTPMGYRTQFSYDSHNNLIALTLPNGTKYQYQYDSRGNVVKSINPSGTVYLSAIYDSKSLPTEIRDALGHTVRFQYDSYGNPIQITDPNDNTITYTYDLLGNLTKSVNVLGHTTSYTYDRAGRLLSLRDPAGNVTTFQYDSYGRLAQMVRPGGRTLSYSYDSANQLIKVVDSAGRTTNFEYNANGQITYIRRGDQYFYYEYNANGKVTGVTRNDQDGAFDDTDLYYDKEGKLTEEWLRIQVYYQYDADGKLVQLKTQNGTVYNYTRNGLGALSALSDGTETFQFTYDADNIRKGITYPNGLGVAYTWDIAHRLSAMNNGVDTYSFSYDAAGHLLSRSGGSEALSYQYDQIGRLTDAGGNNYRYDVAGNILNEGAQYDSRTNRLLSTDKYTFGYDAFGRMTKKTEKESGKYKIYSWNIWDELVKVESFASDGTLLKTLEFSYGPLGRRVWKKVDGVTQYYVYDGANLIEMMDGAYSGIKKRIVYDDGVDAPLMIVDVDSGERYYYHRDERGSITALTDSNGNVVESYRYDAYGNTVKTASVETGNPFAFTGREFDDEDLYYYRARYYDPTIGRFLSEDPVGFLSGDINFYRYVSNDPVNFTDPYGYGFLSGAWSVITTVGKGVVIVGGSAVAAVAIGSTAAVGATVGAAGYAGYKLVSWMKGAGEAMKRNRKRRAKMDEILLNGGDYDEYLRLQKQGINEAKKALKSGYALPGTFVGGDIPTSLTDQVVADVPGAVYDATDTKKPLTQRKRRYRSHQKKPPCN